MKKLLALLVSLTLVAGLVGCSSETETEATPTPEATEETTAEETTTEATEETTEAEGEETTEAATEEETATIADGTYEGVGTGFGDAAINVTITVEGGVFTDVVLATEEEHPVSTEQQATDYEAIEAAVLEANGTVDTVSGVTLSASLAGVNAAIEDAFN